jgi:hypothetical protein
MELAVPPAGAGHFSATTDSSRRSNRPHLDLLWGSLDRRSEEEYRKHGQVARTSTTRAPSAGVGGRARGSVARVSHAGGSCGGGGEAVGSGRRCGRSWRSASRLGHNPIGRASRTSGATQMGGPLRHPCRSDVSGLGGWLHRLTNTNQFTTRGPPSCSSYCSMPEVEPIRLVPSARGDRHLAKLSTTTEVSAAVRSLSMLVCVCSWQAGG